MRAGQLDRRITIQRWQQSGQDAHGQETGSWVALRSCWARRQYIRGQERLEVSQTAATQAEIFRVRGDVDVTPKDRLVFDGVAYDIVSVQPLGRDEGREILAQARAEAHQVAS